MQDANVSSSSNMRFSSSPFVGVGRDREVAYELASTSSRRMRKRIKDSKKVLVSQGVMELSDRIEGVLVEQGCCPTLQQVIADLSDGKSGIEIGPLLYQDIES